MKKIALVIVILLGIPLGFILAVNLLPYHLAKDGIPIAQAICDYRSERGLLPLLLEDLPPKYLAKPPDKAWSFDGRWLSRDAILPRSILIYDFTDERGWELRGTGASLLKNIPRPVIRPFSLKGEALFQSRLAEYEFRIQRQPKELQRYRDKINFLGLAKRNDLLRVECERDAKIFPIWWLPLMARAEVDPPEADSGRRFISWVSSRNDFASFWHLSRYYRSKESVQEALEALRQANGRPLKDNYGEGNFEDRVDWGMALDAANFAYHEKDYHLTLGLCRQWAALYPDNDNVGILCLSFQAAAELGLGQYEAAKRDIGEALKERERNPIWEANFKELYDAAVQHNQKFVFQFDDQQPWELFSEPRP